jgi:hypothetical protein
MARPLWQAIVAKPLWQAIVARPLWQAIVAKPTWQAIVARPLWQAIVASHRGKAIVASHCGKPLWQGHCGKPSWQGHCGKPSWQGHCGEPLWQGHMASHCGKAIAAGHCGKGHCGKAFMAGHYGKAIVASHCGKAIMASHCGKVRCLSALVREERCISAYCGTIQSSCSLVPSTFDRSSVPWVRIAQFRLMAMPRRELSQLRAALPKTVLHYHRAGHGAITSPQTQRGHTAFALTKYSRVIDAHSIHVDTMSFGKMEDDAQTRTSRSCLKTRRLARITTRNGRTCRRLRPSSLAE